MVGIINDHLFFSVFFSFLFNYIVHKGEETRGLINYP